jgi:hypothetical protein
VIAPSAHVTPGLTTLTARIDVMDIQVTYRTPKVLSPAYWKEVIQRSPSVGEIGEALKGKYNNVDPHRVPTPHDALALAAQELHKGIFADREDMPPTLLEVEAYVYGLLEPPF